MRFFCCNGQLCFRWFMMILTIFYSAVIILMILNFLVTLAEEDQSEKRNMSDDEYQEATNMEPSILIDKSILNTTKSLPNTPNKPKIAYSVNNTTFYNDDKPNDEFVQFELYAEKLTNLANRKLFVANEIDNADSQFIYCTTPDVSEDGEPNNDQELTITIQTLSHGIVINSNVYLTHEQWNTIVYIDSILVKCVVCEIFSDAESTDIHIQGADHKKEISRYKPLARFDLSITRKIRDKYHCAVCNETFSVEKDTEHYYSKSHEGNLLSAINKVSDLNLDCVINDNGINTNISRKKNNDYYHFNRGNVNNDRNKINDSYHFNAAAIYRRDSSASESQDDDFEFDCNVNYDNDDDFFWETEQNAQPGNSYATMLKKPKLIEMPMFLERDLGNKKVKVKFDSWHMLISPKLNRFYCMVCKEFSHIRCKPEHCADSSHLEKLEKCQIITRFGDYLIRGIREALHCAICNLPVAASVIYIHIQEPQHVQLLSQALIVNVPGGAPPINKPIAQTPIAQDPAILAVKTSQESKLMPVQNNVTKGKIETTNEARKTPEKTKDKPKVTEIGATKDKQKVTEIIEATKEKLKKEEELTEEEESTINEVDLNASIESDINLDDYVYVKLKNAYFKINVISYNTLVHLGDSKRYCFVCSSKVDEEQLKKHIECRSHLENMDGCKFLDRDGDGLLRQIFLMYHCSTCNVLISRKELKNHLTWPTHTEELSTMQKITKKMRKNELKTTNMYVASTQKEDIYLKEKDTKFKLLFKVKIVQNKDIVLEKKMKIVIVNGDVMKINFDSWHGVVKVKDGVKCQLCQIDFADETAELASHISSGSHLGYLNSSAFNEEYLSDLMRQINDSTLHCMVCNTEVSNKDFMVLEHTDGKKHKKNYETIRTVSSTTSAYTDCEGEVLQL